MAAVRTTAKLIRFSPAELARITAHARACACTPAFFIRETVLGAIPRVRPHPTQAAIAFKAHKAVRDMVLGRDELER
ncbi:MAG: hypothetical protein M3Z54_09460 [Gemmatimonadota bacterium]|nr:hypothetical protein [Gemmatimonadota bacterium]